MKSIHDWLNEKQEQTVSEVSPPGWSGTTAAMLQKHPDIDNPWALSWYMKKKKGAKPHYKEQPEKDSQDPKKPVKKEKYKDEDKKDDDKPKKRKKKVKKFTEWTMEREHPESMMLHEDMIQTLKMHPDEIISMSFADLVTTITNRGIPQPLVRATLAKIQATNARKAGGASHPR